MSTQVFESFIAVLNAIKDFEAESSTRYIEGCKHGHFGVEDWRACLLTRNKMPQCYWKSMEKEMKHAPTIDFDGTPFFYMGQYNLGCHLGVDYGEKKKANYKAEIDRKMMEDHIFTKTRKLVQPTKKKGCGAHIYVTQIVRFPAVQISSIAKKDKVAGSKMLRDNLNNMDGKVEYYVRFPGKDDHNHETENEPLDQTSLEVQIIEAATEATLAPLPMTSPSSELSCTSFSLNSPSHNAPRNQKRKTEDAKDGKKRLFKAAISRLSAPREEDDDEFKAFGRSVGLDLRSINRENPLQAKIAKKLIGEVIFMASTNKLDVDCKVVKDSPM